ncbi:MAG TPA: hypothetical protein VEA18_01530 [Candidatus Kapabacteria bacterium]|nr:hypothetical protein [Candidatus Kapabacteria bacterium]
MFLRRLMMIAIGISALASCFLTLQYSFAQVNLEDQITDQINAGANAAEFSEAKDPRVFATEVIRVLLSIIGMFFLVLILMAGYWYVTAAGDEAKVDKAKDTIQAAIIGLIIVMMAYSITLFVASRISAAVQEGGTIER